MSQTVTSTTPVPATSTSYSGPAASTAGSGAGGTGAGTTSFLSNPPPALSALSTGQMIRGVTSGQNADGTTLIETRFGKIALQIANAPARGAILQLQITQSGNPTGLAVVQTGKGIPAVNTTSQPQSDLVTVRPVPVDGAARNVSPIQARIVNGPIPAPPNGLITGKVLSSPPGGPTTIQTSSGQLSISGTGNRVSGSEIALRAIQPENTPVLRGANAGKTPSLTTLGSAWTALEDVHATLTAHDIRTGPPILPTAIPTTGPQLATGLVFFLNALFHGSMQEWIGRDAMRVLETSDNKDLLRRLGEDFRQMARPAGEPVSGEWRMVMLPLLDDRTLHQIRFYFRQDNDAEVDPDTPPGTRFVVEANLSQLGPLQLDGLVRPARFDLMVRTQVAWPEQIRTDISALFEAANQEFSAQGKINFQVQNPFGIRPDMTQTDDAAGVYA